MGDGSQVAAFARPGNAFAAGSLKGGAVGTAQNIFTPHIKKPVAKHVERRACVRTMIEKNCNRIPGFLHKNTCPEAFLYKYNFFAAVVGQVCQLEQCCALWRRALQVR